MRKRKKDVKEERQERKEGRKEEKKPREEKIVHSLYSGALRYMLSSSRIEDNNVRLGFPEG